MKTLTKNKKITLITSAIIAIIAIISTLIVKNVDKQQANLNPEIQRSMNYTQITDEDAKVEGTDYVKFSSYFTRDLNNDGTAEKLLGTCKNINNTDTLYLDLNVLTNGYLKNGKITINGENFNYNMNMAKDEILKNNYISDNVKTIELNQVNAGTQKLIVGNITPYLQDNINNYTKESTITLTGTHVSDNGEETQISKTININVDWYGTLNTTVYTYGENVYYNIEEINNEQDSNQNENTGNSENTEEENSENTNNTQNLTEKTVTINFSIDEQNKELLLKQNVATITIPDLNGYAPTKVNCTNNNVEQQYDSQTKILTIQKSSTLNNENGIIENKLPYSNTYTVNITYPIEAYENLTQNTTITAKVSGYYVAYNNPNKEFTNPIQSNIAEGQINIIFKSIKNEGNIYDFSVNIANKVYNSKSNNFIISKQELLNLYENTNNNEQTKNIEYTVTWNAYRGSSAEVSSVIMKETEPETTIDQTTNNEQNTNENQTTNNDQNTNENQTTNNQSEKIYGDRFNQQVIQNYTSNKAIYFEGYEKALSTEGTISVYNNDTNELIKTFTIEELKTYTNQNPYIYENLVKHIRIETTTLMPESTLKAYNIKELNTNKIIQDFTKEQIQDVQVIYTYLTGTANIVGAEAGTVNDVDSAYFQSEKSYAEIKVETEKLSAQETLKNEKIYIQTINNQTGDANWKNGSFIVEMPEEIVAMEINNITINSQNTTIQANELTKENGKYILKIITQNETPETYTITIDCNITPKAEITTSKKYIKLYAYNNNCNDYYNTAEDAYDVNQNNVKQEQVGISQTEIELQVATKLTTYQTVTNYNTLNQTTYAPNIAKVEKVQENTSEDNTNGENENQNNTNQTNTQNSKGTAKINIGIINNYTNTINGAQILGKLPFEGNTYILNNENLNSKFTAQITNEGIILPEELKQNAKIYYSENETPNTDLQNTENGWQTKDQIQDLSKIKTYLIIINKELEVGKEHKLSYTVQIPETVNYNITSYTTHTVYYELATEEGNIQQSTEPSKVGIEPVQKYNLDLTTYKINTNEIIKNVTYTLKYEEEDSNGILQQQTKILTANNQEKIIAEGLEVEREYTLNQTYVDSKYELNTQIVKFIVHKDGLISLTGEVRRQGYVDGTLKIELENEVTYNLKINKVNENGEILTGAEFKLTHKDKNIVEINNGTLLFENLYEYKPEKNITAEYTLQEIKAPEKYLLDKTELNFKATRDENGKLQIEILSGEDIIRTNPQTNEKEITTDENTITINIVNKKATEFTITKQDKETGEPLEGVLFAIYDLTTNDFAKDPNGQYIGTKNEDGIYVIATNKDGKINLGLLEGNYKAVEIKTLQDYQIDQTPIYFKTINKNTTEKADFEINYIEDLIEFSQSVNVSGETYSGKTVKLMRTLDFNDDSSYKNPEDTSFGDHNGDGNIEGLKIELTTGQGFKPIGEDSYYSATYVFQGTFDGNGYELRNLYINRPDNDYVGLFSTVRNATIKNLGITGNGKVAGGMESIGTLAGALANATISNCYNTQSVEGIENYNVVGGIVGKINSGNYTTIDKCYNKGSIKGNHFIGGIIGSFNGQGNVIESCYNVGTITGGRNAGGIAGRFDWSSEIYNCYNIGNVTANTAGGISGIVDIHGGAYLANCYNAGKIDGIEEAGGITGQHSYGIITNCYNNGNITATNHGEISGNTGKNPVKNCYYLEKTNTQGIYNTEDEAGVVEALTQEYMKSQEFCNRLNQNINSIDTSTYFQNATFATWFYEGSYPTFILYNLESEVIVENTKLKEFTITKVDDETNRPIPNTKFAIYATDSSYNLVDYAKDGNGNYIGTQENGIYVISTNYEGKINLKLPDGYYKAVEINSNNSYILEENEDIRTTYFKIGNPEIDNTKLQTADLVINNIEDLVQLSIDVNNGNSYEGQTIVLARTLDFNDDNSYKNPQDTNLGDYNGNGRIEGIKEELTTGEGFRPIGDAYYSFQGTFDGNGYELKNLYINRPNYYNYVGLFIKITNATIMNLGITGNGKVVGGRDAIGTLVAYLGQNSTISNCYNTQSVEGENSPYVGGIVGYIGGSNIIIDKCYNVGDIKGKYSGGIIGVHMGQGNVVRNCYNTGTIYGEYAGGIAGLSDWSSEIYNCYNVGNITGEIAGGISGIMPNHGGTDISNCYNTGKIDGTDKAGGIVGESGYGTGPGVGRINNCYNTGNITATNYGEICGCIDKEQVKNCYYLQKANTHGIYYIDTYYEDEVGIVESKSEEYMKSKAFKNLLNSNQETITEDIDLQEWIYQTGEYPKFTWKEYITASEITITNKKVEDYIITKKDKETGAPIKGAQFKIYYSENESYTNITPAKDTEGNYIGTQTTNENGQLVLSLPKGYYKAVEVAPAEGYLLPQQESERTSYFMVSNKASDVADIEINYIEDLVDLSKSVNSGTSYEGQTIKLMRTLDFNDDSSYKNPNDTSTYGDYNEDGKTEGIKAELTNRAGKGFEPIGIEDERYNKFYFEGTFDGSGNEIKNIYIKGRTHTYEAFFGVTRNAKIINLGIVGGLVVGTGSGTAGIVGRADDNIEIINCYSTVDLHIYSSPTWGTAGIIGIIDDAGTVTNCYNAGNINGRNAGYVAGIVASSQNNKVVTINNCYNIGNIINDGNNDGYGIISGTRDSTIIKNCYYLDTSTNKGGSHSNDGIGVIESKTIDQIQSELFCSQLNYNKTQIQSDTELATWSYNPNSYPTLALIHTTNYTITNISKGKEFTITKTDKETKTPLSNVKFAIYNTETNDFAKDKLGNYIGTKNENGTYVLTTNSEGKITVNLPDGYYKAVEIETAENYILEENELSRTTYFKIGDDSSGADIEINYIEDLVDLSNTTYPEYTNGVPFTHSGKTIKLQRTLDFKDDSSYKDPNDTSYGDYNGDGVIEGIKTELTKESGQGFRPIGGYSTGTTAFAGVFDGNGYEIKNLYINRSLYGIGFFSCINNATIKNLGITGNGSVNKSGNSTGGLVGYSSYSEIYNCYNTQKVSGSGETGGLIGSSHYSKILNSYNKGNIVAGGIIGGIVGLINGSQMYNCYNDKDIGISTISSPISGIAAYASNSSITNCYNNGNVTTANAPAGGIVSYIASNCTITNCYNTGTITSSIPNQGAIIGGEPTNTTITNCYYKTGTAPQGIYNQSDELGIVEARTETELKSTEFTELLNNNKNKISSEITLLNWTNENGQYPSLGPLNIIKDTQVTVENEKMKVLTITKQDKETGEKLAGAEFKVETIKEVGTDVGNSNKIINTINNSVIGNIKTNTTYGFVQNGTTWVSNNTNINNSTARAYFPIDLTNFSGTATLSVNASISSQSGYDLGYATIATDTYDKYYYNSTGRFIYTSGTVNSKTYTTSLQGGKMYYLHIGYYKNSSTSSGTDKFTINSINISGTEYVWNIQSNSAYSFQKQGTKYVSNNTNINTSVANSYIPINLNNATGRTYLLELNASISSEKDYDIGYATIKENTTTPSYEDEEGRFVYMTGEENNKIYSIELKGGKTYYLHLGYKKDANNNVGDDKFTINSITLNQLDTTYTEYKQIQTNDEGIAKAYVLPNTKVRIIETKAPDGYVLNRAEQIVEIENEDAEIVVQNEKLKPLTTTITKSDIDTQLPIQGTKFEIYSVTPAYEIIDFAKDENGNYIGKSENEKYVVTTDELGKIKLSLPEGYYKAVEVQASEGYKLEEDENLRTTYFKLENKNTSEENTTIQINYIEDLIDLSNKVNLGDNLSGKTIVLNRTLDFNDNNSYKNAEDTTTYGDYNKDGTVEAIKTELTNTTGRGFIPIGTSSNPFKGDFNGNGFEIRNLYININSATSNDIHVGLFGYIENSRVENVGITGSVKVIGLANIYTYIGGIIGYSKDSKISNCNNQANITQQYGGSYISDNSKKYLGGIVSYADKGEIIGCYNIGTISGSVLTTVYVGGIVSYINDVDITSCYNTGNLTSSSSSYGYTGGIACYINNSSVNNCYNDGTVNSYGGPGSSSGGIVYYATKSNIINTRNTGNINVNGGGGAAVGGIAASAENCNIVNSCNIGNVNGRASSPCYTYGIAGNSKNANIFNCSNAGNIYSNSSVYSYAYGIAGSGNISNCYNIGNIETLGGRYGNFNFVISGTLTNTTNCYYLNTTAESGIQGQEDVEGKIESKTQAQMQSQDFTTKLNQNRLQIQTTLPLYNWQYNENAYPTLIPNTFINKSEITITNKKLSQITVHHYKQGTGPEFGTEPVILADDEITIGNEGENYTTSPKTDIEHYKLSKDENGDDLIPQNATGTYKSGNQDIYYYYTRDPLNVTVHHYLEGTGPEYNSDPTILAKDESYTYEEGEHYKVTPSQELLQKYEVVKIVGDEEKDITQDEEITYYYKQITHQITTKVEIPNGRQEKGGTISGEGLEPYETVEHEKSSEKQIIITPDSGYKVQQIKLITINSKGEKTETILYGPNKVDTAEITYRQNIDGTITLTQFSTMTEDKQIIVQFAPNEGRVIVHHYIENSTEKIHIDQVTIDVIDKLVQTQEVQKQGYALVESPEQKDVIITEQTQEKTYYYQEQYEITTDVIEHNEKYSDGTILKNVKGGTITNEDKNPHEYVLKNRDSKQLIKITPNTGYEIVKITINNEEFDYSQMLDETGSVTLPEGFFKNMQENKHIEVEFRKKTAVYVKYLEEETEKVLFKDGENDYIKIEGYENQEYETLKKAIPYHIDSTLGITNENKEPTSSNGTMYADEITIIYWYAKIPSGIIERHIEINEKGETKELETKLTDGYVSEKVTTNRKEYKGYIPVDGPKNTNENVTVVAKEENSKTVTFEQNKVVEVWYYYEKQYDINTKVKPHKEEIINEQTGEKETILKDGGTISKKYEKDDQGNDKLDEQGNKIETVYEQVLSRGNTKEKIEIKPEEGYKIKTVTKQKIILQNGEEIKQEETIFIEDKIKEDGSVTLEPGYIQDVQNDYNIIVEFEKIPAKVIVQYKDAYTKESIIEDKIVNGYVYDNYNEQRAQIESYIPADPEPTNNKGTMTKEPITVTYWYTKQFKITTDVKEHEEIVEEEESDNEGTQTTVMVKGGTITGEDEAPYEIVTRGENNKKEIVITPDQGYRIKELTINNEIISIENIIQEGKITLPAETFTNMQEDKHIVVEFEKIPATVKVYYLEEETEKVLYKTEEGEEYEQIQGYINDEYKTTEKQIPYYELTQEKYPQNSQGKMEKEETIVKYYYKKIPFNLKIEKEIQTIKVNGTEQAVNLINNKLAKIEVNYKDINSTNIEITYKIKVTNTHQIEGTAQIEEYIPEGFEFIIQTSTEGWQLSEGRYVLQTETIKPQETKEYQVTLRWKQENKNEGQKPNIAKITKTENEPKFEEILLTDNEDTATVEIKINKTLQDIINGTIEDIKDGNIEEGVKEVIKDVVTTVKTGDLIALYISLLVIAGVGLVVVIKKKKTNK